MKRLLKEEERVQRVEFETEYGEEECKGALTLPSNAKIYRSTFSLKEPGNVDQDDMVLLANIITYCSMKIAQKHQDVRVKMSRHKRIFDETLTITYYILSIEMPSITRITSFQMTGIHLLNESLLTDDIPVDIMEGGGMKLTIIVQSTTNPVEFECVDIVRQHFKRIRHTTYETPNEEGSMKRTRKS